MRINHQKRNKHDEVLHLSFLGIQKPSRGILPWFFGLCHQHRLPIHQHLPDHDPRRYYARYYQVCGFQALNLNSGLLFEVQDKLPS